MAPPAGARCGKHPDVAAVDVCQRCGTFTCSSCVEIRDEEVYCAVCAAILDRPPSRRVRALRWISAGWFGLLLVLFAVAGVTRFAVPWLVGALATPIVGAVLTGLWLAEWRAQRRGESPSSGRTALWVSAVFIGLEDLIGVGLIGALVFTTVRFVNG